MPQHQWKEATSFLLEGAIGDIAEFALPHGSNPPELRRDVKLCVCRNPCSESSLSSSIGFPKGP